MDNSTAEDDQQYYNYADEDHDKRLFDSNNDDDNYDESITGISSASTCTDDANYNPSQQHYSFDSYDFERSQNYIGSNDDDDDDDDASYYSEEGSWADDDDEDDSLGFPPGYITTLAEMQDLHSNTNNSTTSSGSSDNNNGKNSFVNPSIIPSYFFCPLTETIMKDPVITPDGTTFERVAILRWLILQPCNPVTGISLSHTDLVVDHLVRTSIDKARKEAWVRYVVEFRDDDAEKVYEEKVVEKEKKQKLLSEVIDSSLLLDAEVTGEESEQPPVSPREIDPQSVVPSVDDKVSISSATLNSAYDPGQRNHGWLVPLGVHKIVCSSPGLIVTADVHRRSKVVKRRKLKKSLAGGKGIEQKKKKKSIKKRIGNAVSPRKKRTEKEEYERRVKNIKTTTTAVTQDLLLPSGTHVEISETRIHGGRVRGKVCWEEEVTVELDADLVEEMKRQEEIVEMMAKVRVSPSKKKAFFRRKQDRKGGEGEEDVVAQTVPYSSNLSLNEIPPPSPRQQKKSRSPSPLTTIKYTGWISLQWAGAVGNYEKDEAMKRRRNAINVLKENKVDDYHPHLISDEDDGPWSQPLPLGAYRIGNDYISVFDTPEANSNCIGTLNSGDVIEVVETKVVMMKRRVSESEGLSMLTSDFEGIRTVRARCMMTSDDSAYKKRFKSGWITLSEEGKSDRDHSGTATPIPVGAHVVSSKEPLMSYSGSQIKSILPSGSCMEVDATRLEFDETENVECDCGQESSYPVIAVKALISLGGYATLSTHPMGKSSQCACGKEIVTNPRHYAEPVALGVYKIVQSDGVFLTEGIGPNTPIVTTLKQNACAEVVETRVEEGCVRGKIDIFLSCDLSEMGDKNTGWISLFEPPSFVWAELVSE